MVVAALKLLVKYQGEQTDKGGHPYVLHPIRLALQLDNETQRAAALLHDIIEDTDCTYHILRQEGISEDIIDIVRILTKKKDESYFNYVKRVKDSKNINAIKIKKLDLIDNMDLTRLKEVTQKDIDRVENRYKKAFELLSE